MTQPWIRVKLNVAAAVGVQGQDVVGDGPQAREGFDKGQYILQLLAHGGHDVHLLDSHKHGGPASHPPGPQSR